MKNFKHGMGLVARKFIGIPKAIGIVNQKSYFSEKKKKSYIVRFIDNIGWCLRNSGPNIFYNLYGLDIKGTNSRGYISEVEFWPSLYKVNHAGQPDSQQVLLRDKFLFYKFMKLGDLPVPKVFGLIRGGVLFDNELNQLPLDSISSMSNYFVKDIDGQCASFVKRIDDYKEFTKQLPSFPITCILQEAVIQHSEMDRLNPGAINTLRIVTINQHGNIYPLTSLLRIGTKKTGNVDNWAVGGIAIGVNNDGYLKEFGFYKPMYGLKTDIHPDSGIIFSQFKIPYYQDALKLACEAHKYFYNLTAIGWDVAIGKDGPVFIEGNDNWEISLQQACDRPLREELEKVFNNEFSL